MFNLLEATTGTVNIDTFLEYGSKLLEWIIAGMQTLLNGLMNHPVTAVFLIIGLVYVVIGIVRRFTN